MPEAGNPAAAEMIAHLAETGVETLLDRLEAQSPQCRFGSTGVCCRMCQWGPCRITKKSPRGVCGRDLELVAVANLVRAVAGGCSAQMMHAREMAIALRAAARGEIALELPGTRRLREVAAGLNVGQSWTPVPELAELVASAILEDLGKIEEGATHGMGFALRERRREWERLGVVPRSAAFEIAESLHMTTLGGCSDWRELFMQAVRTGLAHIYTALVPSSLLTDVIFGVPEPRTIDVNYGILQADHVNVLMHGHSPVMLEKVLDAIGSDEIQQLAREQGAAGIVVGGMCCTGHEALARRGVPTVTGSMGQELILGTGAVDAVVVDMQCVIPGMADVARCFGTQIITTYNSNRIPGAEHVPFDPEHPESLEEDAMRVARLAIEAYARRDRSHIHIPQHTTRVMTGFSHDSVMRTFGSSRLIAEKLETGELPGIVAMVGCTSPKSGVEVGHATIARELIGRGVLVLASGCAAHALVNAGLCSLEATALAAPGLREICEEAGVPPVLAMGSCADNTRIVQIFSAVANKAEIPLPEMPFAISGAEFANEKTMGQMLGALAHGLSVVVGQPPQLPLATSDAAAVCAGGCSGDDGGAEAGHETVLAAFLQGAGLRDLFGANVLVQPDPTRAGATIVAELDRKRAALGWPPVGEIEQIEDAE
jgi:carbon-monoxide dehydrogenase catalytic subunit